MSDTSQPPETAGFWESRTGWSRLKKALLLEPLPGGSRWAAAFGSLLLFTFVLQVITGILMTMSYAPSTGTAWQSVYYMQEHLPLGWFIRAVHNWCASAMVILLLVHMAQVFVWGAYKRPRELTWMVGVLLLFCTMALAFTGYLLPWDQKAYWATKVGLDIVGTIPVIGNDLHTVLQGGPHLGNYTLTRFFTIHAFLLPGLLILLIVVHLYLFRVHGVTPPWWETARQLTAEREPFWPGQAWKDALLSFGFLLALGVWCYFFPAPLGEQADPAKPYDARPDWYFMFLFQLLKYIPGPYEVVGTFVLPTLFFLILFFWPFLDRNPERDPRKRPVAISLLGVGTAGLIGLTVFSMIASRGEKTPPELATSREKQTPKPAGPLQRMQVARTYRSACAGCHGADGSGSPVRKSLPTVPDFTSLAWQMSHTDVTIAHQIQDGSPPLMPPFRNKLSKDQILGLTVFVRAFAVEKPRAGQAPGKTPSENRRVAALSAEKGYRSLCLACHGPSGTGNQLRKAMPNMPDFTNSRWQSSHADSALKHAILHGKGKYMLPLVGILSAGEADRLVSLVRAFRDGKQVIAIPAPAGPASAIEKRVRVASQLYQQNCLTCHGPQGTGQRMRDSMPSLPDFSSSKWQQTHSDTQLADAIENGKGLIMPAWKGTINNQQTRDLVAYLRAMGPPPKRGNAVANSLDQRFRRLQRQMAVLKNRLQHAKK